MHKFNSDFELNLHDDEDFLANLERRVNLDEIFNNEIKTEDENHTLKYKPVKQRNSVNKLLPSTPPVWSTEVAKVATAFRENESVGVVAVALLKNPDNHCKIVVYKTKTQIFSTLTLTSEADVNSCQLHKQSYYVQFYDDTQIYWSVHFEKQSDEDEFIKRLADFKFNIKQDREGSETNRINTADYKEQKKEQKKTHDANKETANKSDKSKQHSKKNTLITRVTKMGGQLLPKLPTTQQTIITNVGSSSESSDYDLEPIVGTAPYTTYKQHKDKPHILPRSKIQATKTQLMTLPITKNITYEAAATSANAIEAQFVQMMLSENRTQNTEIRINLNKLESKLEKVLDKVDSLSSVNLNQRVNNKDDEILELEVKLLELKKENRRLKQTKESNTLKNNDAEYMNTIMEKYQDDLEKMGLQDLQNCSVEELVGSLLKRATADLLRLVKSEADSVEYCKKLNETELRLNEEKDKNMNTIAKVAALEQTVVNLRTSLEQIDTENQELKAKLLEVKTCAELEEQHEFQTEYLVKGIMNNLYGDLANKIESLAEPCKNDILAIIGKTIREQTLKAISEVPVKE